jgi:hypothetical protein
MTAPPTLVDHVRDTLGAVRVALRLLADDDVEEAYVELENLEAKLALLVDVFSIGGAQ